MRKENMIAEMIDLCNGNARDIDYFPADFLVNAGEPERYAANLERFRRTAFRTATGPRFLNAIFR